MIAPTKIDRHIYTIITSCYDARTYRSCVPLDPHERGRHVTASLMSCHFDKQKIVDLDFLIPRKKVRRVWALPLFPL